VNRQDTESTILDSDEAGYLAQNEPVTQYRLIDDDNAYSYERVTPTSFRENKFDNDESELFFVSLSDVQNDSEYPNDLLWKCTQCGNINTSLLIFCNRCRNNVHDAEGVFEQPIAYRTRHRLRFHR
jgi:hypothetical protein